MSPTLISWTNETWNPVSGCHKVSEGCRYCYAETLSLRFGWSKKPWTAANAADNVILHPERLRKPMTWKNPSMVFVNSMSDMFHPLVPDEYIARVFDVMISTPQHTYQILTKRPDRAETWKTWASNIWMGATVEDIRVEERIGNIRNCGAPIKFLSCEPLLGPLNGIDLSGIDWIITGGESGAHLGLAEKALKAGQNPRAVDPRWMDMKWARDLRDISVRDGAAYFFKQDSGLRTEMRPWLVEEDGSRWQWHQWPGKLDPPERMLE